MFQKPVYESFSSLSARKQSFMCWPAQYEKIKDELIDMGYFYTGLYIQRGLQICPTGLVFFILSGNINRS